MKAKSGDIVLIDLGNPPFGHEQAGVRPAVFVSESNGISIVLPITSNNYASRFKHSVIIDPTNKNKLKVTSIVLVFQLRAVDNRRIFKKLGSIDVKTRRSLNTVLRSIALL